MNQYALGRFYENLEEVYAEENYDAHHIFNVDETGFSTSPPPVKIIAEKGQRQVGKIVSAERGQTITVVCAFSAGGDYIPPMFIFPRVNMTNLLMKGSPPGSVGNASDSGYTSYEDSLVCCLTQVHCIS